MGSSSFNAVESTRFAVRTVAGELVSLPFAMSWADEAKRMPPSVRGSIFEISITRELVEIARTVAAVVGAKRVDRVAYADQRGASLTHARAVAFSHAQDGNRAEHREDEQDWSDAPQHQQPSEAPAPFPREANAPLAGETP